MLSERRQCGLELNLLGVMPVQKDSLQKGYLLSPAFWADIVETTKPRARKNTEYNTILLENVRTETKIQDQNGSQFSTYYFKKKYKENLEFD